jgi:hypothetical protein
MFWRLRLDGPLDPGSVRRYWELCDREQELLIWARLSN